MRFASLIAVLGAVVLLAPGAAWAGDKPLQMFGVEGLVRDESPDSIKNIEKRLGQVMKDLTGLDAEATVSGDAFTVAKALDSKECQLGVFQGFEFAWLQKRYPNFKPLLIAVNEGRHYRACLIVPKTSKAKGWADLKGTKLALALGSKGHCLLYMERGSQTGGKTDPKSFFADIQRPAFAEAALDEVCGLKADATVVDKVSWELYQRVKPGNAAHLKIIEESEIFPAAVIAYRADTLPKKTLDAIRTGLPKAPDNARARQLMNLVRITGFEPIPDDYAQTLADILKNYPAPAEKK